MAQEQLATNEKISWEPVERPGYFGSRKDALVARWNATYGEGNWVLGWETPYGRLGFDQMFVGYIAAYTKYFMLHPEEAAFLTDNYSYAYDRDLIMREQAFDHRALYELPGVPNQFHHVALNIALEVFLGLPFKGDRPIQVRGPETEGGRWNPGHMPITRPDLLPTEVRVAGWWEDGSIEQAYQSFKTLYVRPQQ